MHLPVEIQAEILQSLNQYNTNFFHDSYCNYKLLKKIVILFLLK